MYFRREVREVSSDVRADHGSQYRRTDSHPRQFADPGLRSNYCMITAVTISLLPSLVPHNFATWQFCIFLSGPATPWLALCRHPDSPSLHGYC